MNEANQKPSSGSGSVQRRQRSREPAVGGLFTLGETPRLVGSRLGEDGPFFFPKLSSEAGLAAHGSEPAHDVLLSRSGALWSYTTSHFLPPPPYVVDSEPFEPIVFAAVYLAAEDMVVCGQMMPGTDVAGLSVGMPVELKVDTLHEADDCEYLVWKWDVSEASLEQPSPPPRPAASGGEA